MNALVVYDSQYGNTERIAQAIVEALLGVGEARAIRVGAMLSDNLQGVDMLILGSPTQGWRPTKPMQALLQGFTAERLRNIDVACFDTRFLKPRWLTGSAANVMGKRLHSLGVPLLAPPESFFVQDTEGPLVKGEVERAAEWAKALANVAGLQPLARR